MGAKLEFRCESCGYEAMVSGRDDFGFKARTTTILCEECEELYDVVTSISIHNEGAADRPEIEPKCPRSNRHTVGRWEHPGACPKCGDEMTGGDKITMWD